MNDNTKDKIYSIITVSVILLIIVIGIVKWVPRFRQHTTLKEKDAAYDAESAELNRKIEEINQRTERFKTDSEQVEAEARRDNLVHKGEIVFVFDKKDSK